MNESPVKIDQFTVRSVRGFRVKHGYIDFGGIEMPENLVTNEEGEAILCSECYDERGCEHIIAIIPLSACAACGRACLGYLTPVTFDAQ